MMTMEENKKDLFTENPPSRSVEALLGEKRTSCQNYHSVIFPPRPHWIEHRLG